MSPSNNKSDTSSIKTDSDQYFETTEDVDDISSAGSFASDSSYYDEVEDFEVVCINKDQHENLKFYKMAKK
tara:strand:+ start:236 stop:448 length:213 start_codon:yes stop_codon:yes gene_type:complete